MTDRELKIDFNFRKYNALETALKKDGKSVEGEMKKLIERLYSDNVSEQERREVERLVKKDEQEVLKAEKQFAIINIF